MVAGLYRAYLAGDSQAVAGGLAPDIRWHSSGFDVTSGTLVGIEAVLQHLHGQNHMDDYTGDFVQLLRIV